VHVHRLPSHRTALAAAVAVAVLLSGCVERSPESAPRPIPEPAPAVPSESPTQAQAATPSGTEPTIGQGLGVSGNRLTLDGQPFVARGFNMVGLLTPGSCPQPSSVGLTAQDALDEAQLREARDVWAATTVRFQVSQRALDPADPLHGEAYVLSMQDQSIGCGTAHPLPTEATLRAWRTLAPRFADDPYVAYELFNEPDNQPTVEGWRQWREGGSAPLDNQGDPAVGHQRIVEEIRDLGARNVLVADGARKGAFLRGVPYLEDPLPAARLAYAVHPYFFHLNRTSTLAQDTASWERRYGEVARIVPVVATEWNMKSNGCVPGAVERAPQFLDFLEQRGIGLLVHAFDVPGTVRRDLTGGSPTAIQTGSCRPALRGVGELVQAYFRELRAPES
jgi:hypothetical protein